MAHAPFKASYIVIGQRSENFIRTEQQSYGTICHCWLLPLFHVH
jgi:hypothetical protein